MFDDTNPYKLRIEMVQDRKQFYVSFQNIEKEQIETEVTNTIADILFQDFVRTERNLRRSDERNLEHLELTEQALHQRALYQIENLESTVIQKLDKEKLWQAINTLPKTQRRRLILYYFKGLTYEQIAKIEGCKYQSIQEAIKAGEEKIKNIFLK